MTGHGREEIGFLIFPNVAACRALCPEISAEAPARQVLRDSRILERVREGLRALAQSGTGSSTFATRALLMEEPPSIEAGEITDKGYINQRAVRMHRADLVAHLYSDVPDGSIIALGAI